MTHSCPTRRSSDLLNRLGGRVDRFAFVPQEDFLRGVGEVKEPHSFDVKVRGIENGRTHDWAYASYEGRTTIAAEAARAGGVKSERAGPVSVDRKSTRLNSSH